MDISENCPAAGLNNAIREVMAITRATFDGDIPIGGNVEIEGLAAFTHPNSSTTGAIVIRDAAGNPGGGYLQWTNADRTAEYVYLRGVNGSINSSGNINPTSDNANSLGLAGNRWSVIYAGTGTIDTSDEHMKAWRGALTAAELAAAKAIVGELGIYRWLDAVEAKGPDARLHFGARAQRVWAIMAEHGLVDPIGPDGKPGKTPYAFLCWDEWETPEGSGSRYGLRLDQLTLFLIAGLDARLTAGGL